MTANSPLTPISIGIGSLTVIEVHIASRTHIGQSTPTLARIEAGSHSSPGPTARGRSHRSRRTGVDSPIADPERSLESELQIFEREGAVEQHELFRRHHLDGPPAGRSNLRQLHLPRLMGR